MGKIFKLDPEDDDQDHTQPEVGGCLTQQGQSAAEQIPKGIAFQGDEDADGDGDDNAKDDGDQGELQGGWHAAEDQFGDFSALQVGASQVALCQVEQEHAVLHQDGFVQPQGFAYRLALLSGGGLGHQQANGVAGHTSHDKDQQGNA